MKFTIPGKPKGKARARTTKQGHTYTPADTVNYENWVKLCYKNADGEYFGDALVLVAIECFYAIPKSFSKKKRELALKGILQPSTKPDVDNIVKSVLDGLNGIAYDDDKQVVGLWILKFYGEEPRLEVQIIEGGAGAYEIVKR